MAEIAPSPAQTALCEKLAPVVIQITQDYYLPDRPHPYLLSTVSGGILRTIAVGRETEDFTQVDVNGVRVGFEVNSDVAQYGLPPLEPGTILWAIATSHESYPQHIDDINEPYSFGPYDRSLAYWDGTVWHSVRAPQGEHLDQGTREVMWKKSQLGPLESLARKAIANQTRGRQEIDEVYPGNPRGFIDHMKEIPSSGQEWLELAFTEALGQIEELQTAGLALQNYMRYNLTGFQRMSAIQPVPRNSNDVDLGLTSNPVDPIKAALANMYRGSALLSEEAIQERARQATESGNPYPLPVSW